MAIGGDKQTKHITNPGTSFMKSQTQKGPKANSKSINRVNSAAIKYLEAYIKIELGINEIILPRSIHFNKSSTFAQLQGSLLCGLGFDQLTMGSISFVNSPTHPADHNSHT